MSTTILLLMNFSPQRQSGSLRFMRIGFSIFLATTGLYFIVVILNIRPLLYSAEVCFHIGIVLELICISISTIVRTHYIKRLVFREKIKNATVESFSNKSVFRLHFLLNSAMKFTSLLDPEAQNKFAVILNDFSNEFREITRMSALELTTIREEINLCKFRLANLTNEAGKLISFENLGLCPEDKIPPFLFHSAIEMQTHCLKNKTALQKVSIQKTSTRQDTCFKIRSEGDFVCQNACALSAEFQYISKQLNNLETITKITRQADSSACTICLVIQKYEESLRPGY